MTGILNAKDATVSAVGIPPMIKFQKPALSVTAGLVGLYLIDNLNTLQDNLLNYANANLPLTPLGTVTASDFGVSLSAGVGYDTGLMETEEMTVVSVFKPLTTLANLMVTVGNSTSAGSGLAFHCGAGALRAGFKNGANVYVQVPNMLTGVSENSWVAGVAGYGITGIHLGKSVNGVYNETLQGSTGRTLTSGTLRIGAGQWAGGYGNAWQCAFIAIYERKLNGSERADICDDLRSYYSTAGITTI